MSLLSLWSGVLYSTESTNTETDLLWSSGQSDLSEMQWSMHSHLCLSETSGSSRSQIFAPAFLFNEASVSCPAVYIVTMSRRGAKSWRCRGCDTPLVLPIVGLRWQSDVLSCPSRWTSECTVTCLVVSGRVWFLGLKAARRSNVVVRRQIMHTSSKFFRVARRLLIRVWRC